MTSWRDGNYFGTRRNLSNQGRYKVYWRAADIAPTSPISSAFPSASLPSALSSGLATINTASGQLNRDAEQIANPDNQNLINPLVDLRQSSLLAEAGAAVIRASNDTLGILLNAFA